MAAQSLFAFTFTPHFEEKRGEGRRLTIEQPTADSPYIVREHLKGGAIGATRHYATLQNARMAARGWLLFGAPPAGGRDA